MSNATQLSLIDTFYAVAVSARDDAAKLADKLACIADKVQADDDLGLLGGDDSDA